MLSVWTAFLHRKCQSVGRIYCNLLQPTFLIFLVSVADNFVRPNIAIEGIQSVPHSVHTNLLWDERIPKRLSEQFLVEKFLYLRIRCVQQQYCVYSMTCCAVHTRRQGLQNDLCVQELTAAASSAKLHIYRVSQEECEIIRESVPWVKVYRYNPKHLYPKLNGYGDNGQRSLKLWQLLHTYGLPNTYWNWQEYVVSVMLTFSRRTSP